jgi:error-prone DNA polymerase
MSEPRYAELQVTSHFSFLRGAPSCEELFASASATGIEALAIVDRNSLAGIVRAHEAAKTTGVRLVVGCRLDLTDGSYVLVYPTDRPAYSRLCRLLSLGKKRAGKAKRELGWSDLIAYGDGLIAVLVPDAAGGLCSSPPPAARGVRRPRPSRLVAAPAAERSAPPA